MTIPFIGIIGICFIMILLVLFLVVLLCAARPQYRNRLKAIIENYRHPKKKKYRRKSRKYRPVSNTPSDRIMEIITEPNQSGTDIMHSPELGSRVDSQNITYPVVHYDYDRNTMYAHDGSESPVASSQADSDIALLPHKHGKKSSRKPRKSVVFNDVIDEIDIDNNTITRNKLRIEEEQDIDLIQHDERHSNLAVLDVHTNRKQAPHTKEPPVLRPVLDGHTNTKQLSHTKEQPVLRPVLDGHTNTKQSSHTKEPPVLRLSIDGVRPKPQTLLHKEHTELLARGEIYPTSQALLHKEHTKTRAKPYADAVGGKALDETKYSHESKGRSGKSDRGLPPNIDGIHPKSHTAVRKSNTEVMIGGRSFDETRSSHGDKDRSAKFDNGLPPSGYNVSTGSQRRSRSYVLNGSVSDA